MRSAPSVVAIGALAAVHAIAATYYISPTGNNTNSCTSAQSAASAKATFSSAWGCLEAGDTLVVQDGTYSENWAPPSGKAGVAGSPITVRAANDGNAKITGQAVFVNNSYITVQGLTVTGPANNTALSVTSSDSSATASHHITLQRMGIRCPLTGSTVNDNTCVDVSAGANHNLMEDSWIWGGGRYILLCYGRDSNGSTSVTGCDYNTFRRIVIRQGPNVSSGGNPQAGLSVYYGSNNVIENVIVIDSQPNSDSSNSAFYLTGHAAPPGISNNRYYGLLALNITGGSNSDGWQLDVDGGGTANNNAVYNSVFWKVNANTVDTYINGTCTGTIIDHIISGEAGGVGMYNGCSGTSLTSSIFQHPNTGGIQQSSSRGSYTTHDYNLLWNVVGSPYVNVTAGAHDLAVNPLLKYIGRIETATPCVGAGSGATNCGADLTYRYQDGALSTTNLWPWPNEARIQKEMCTDSGITTGFCNSTSLTTYIWTYLGNPVPSDLGGPSAPSPCDLNLDGVVNSTDVDLATSQVLNPSTCGSADLQRTGSCDVVDVQRIVNASLGQACRTGP